MNKDTEKKPEHTHEDRKQLRQKKKKKSSDALRKNLLRRKGSADK